MIKLDIPITTYNTQSLSECLLKLPIIEFLKLSKVYIKYATNKNDVYLLAKRIYTNKMFTVKKYRTVLSLYCANEIIRRLEHEKVSNCQ